MSKSKLSQEKQLRLIEHFVAGTTARTASVLVGVNRKTSTLYYHRLRELISSYEKEKEEEIFKNEIESNSSVIQCESYFGEKRKIKKGSKESKEFKESYSHYRENKISVFGLLKKDGQVYIKMIDNDISEISKLMPSINEANEASESSCFIDEYNNDNILYSDEYFSIKNTEKNEKITMEEKKHINGVKNFCNQAKRHLRKFNGIPKEHFYLFIKECQFRYNNKGIEKQLEIVHNLVKKELF